MKQLEKTTIQKKTIDGMLSKFLDEVRDKTYKEIVKWINENFPNILNKLAIEAIELKEDYERALFVRLGYQSLDKNWEMAIDAMAALELLDGSLLIVDDIIDGSIRRKGKDTIHKAWGVKNAIILSSMLKSTSLLALLFSAKLNSLSSKEFYTLQQFVESTYNNMYIGEYLDLYYESQPFEEVSIDNYLEVIKRTTGFHFGMAIKIGGILAQGAEDYLEILWDIGVRFGMLLQIRDDFIDYLDIENITYKPSFGDFKRNKKRLPLILAYKFFPENINKLKNILLDDSAKREIQFLISHPKIRRETMKIIDSIDSDIDSLIKFIDPSSVRRVLKDFYIIVRDL